MQQARIGVFDSGIGGLTVAREIRKLLPVEGLIYVADNGRAPYGPQSPESIVNYSREITEFLIARGACIIVIACNTATSAAIKHLRQAYPRVLFVGMEPAIKPAAAKSESGKIGVMATELTLKGDRYQQLVDRFAPAASIFTNPCSGLVPLIERGDWNNTDIQEKLDDILTPMLEAGIDTLVLGCTHYPFLKDHIEAICGTGVSIINPAPAAARQTVRLLAELPAAKAGGCQPLNRFYATGSGAALEMTLAHLAWTWRLCEGMKTCS